MRRGPKCHVSARFCCVVGFVLIALSCEAQYKGDHIPGFAGLESGSQTPPGLCLGDIIWVYPTSTVKDNAGNSVHLPGSLTSTAEIILVSAVTNYKLFGGNVGASVGLPFIKNRIQTDSLDVSTGFAYTDMFVNAALGWHLKRADIIAGYNLYIPTVDSLRAGTDNTGLGMLNRPKWGLMQFLRAAEQAEVNAKFSVQRLGIIADNIKPTAFCRSFRSEGTDDYVAS